jgi:hypothetical protein
MKRLDALGLIIGGALIWTTVSGGFAANSAWGTARAPAPASPAPASPGVPGVTQSATNTFSYQGQLKKAGAPVNGGCDFRFAVFDAATLGTDLLDVARPNVNVTTGLFTVQLSYDPAVTPTLFDGDPRWIETSLRCPAGAGPYTTLSPRQPLTAAPYAIGLLPGAVISGTLQNELTVHASAVTVSNPAAVHGIAGGPAGITPSGPVAVWAESHDGAGVMGASDFSVGVYGFSEFVVGVYGNSDTFYGVEGYSISSDGVHGISHGASGYGVYGSNDNGGTGVIGTSSNIGVLANNATYTTTAYLGAPCCAGDFYGTVSVHGDFNVSNGTKNFVIDDPLDPANKVLYHAAVEAPQMINFYNGTALLDPNGEAVVQLPAWFDAINTDFHYQLTAVGAPMPNLYVAEEVHDNRFKIAGGKPGAKVSWQVTATRHDAWAAQHPFQVEAPKPPAERGTYLYPVGYGQPITATVRSARYGQ